VPIWHKSLLYYPQPFHITNPPHNQRGRMNIEAPRFTNPRNKKIVEYVLANPAKHTVREVAEMFRVSIHVVYNLKKRCPIEFRPDVNLTEVQPVKKTPKSNPREGMEVRGDNVVINWTQKTVITDLGEFGNFVCDFTTHGAIQRAYVHAYEGKGQTASEVATRFDFPHAKAVYLYAKAHGFTKSSPGQTDIEFEQGMTPEEAAEDTLQSLKRRALKLTEQRKWREVQKDADKWYDLERSVLYPLKDWIEENLPSYTPPVLTLKPVTKGKFCAVVGVSDWHYMKLAFSNDGKETYNRKIARKKLLAAESSLLSELVSHGTPEIIYLPIGTDNLHIDNPQQTTTRGTPQAGQTDGDWRQSLPEYVDVMINMIEAYSQLAPVDVISIPGNHDKHTSFVIGIMLKLFFEKNERVTVTTGLHPRVYKRYGKVCHVFDHGDDKSLPKFRANMHKSVLTEAKEQGVNINAIDEWIFYSGHLHHESSIDLGSVFHYVIPSLAGIDAWERSGMYLGSKKQATLYLADPIKGRKAVLYSG
jgi:transposase